MTGQQYTPEQIEAVIPEAIRRSDWPAVESLLAMLAVIAPHRAQAVIDTIGIGATLARDDR